MQEVIIEKVRESWYDLGMKKYGVLIIITVIAILATTGGVLLLNKNKSSVNQPANNNGKTANGKISRTEQGISASLQNAMVGTGSVQCVFKDETGKQTTSYIKGGKIRADIVSSNPQESGSFIMKDKTMYFWNAQKQGYTMSLGNMDLAQMAESMKDSQNPQAQDQVFKDLDKYKDSCKQADISDDMFTQPGDISFKDYSSMINKQGEASPSIDQKQVEEMMKQYQNR
jgi:hypothetical protein